MNSKNMHARTHSKRCRYSPLTDDVSTHPCLVMNAVFSRGYKMAEAGDFASALLLFRKALELDGDSAVLRELCAQCLMEMERWDEAYK